MEGSGSIESGEDAATGKARQVVGDIGEREGILLCDSIELPVVGGPADLLPILLGNGDKRKRLRQVCFLYHPLFQPPINLLS